MQAKVILVLREGIESENRFHSKVWFSGR